LGSGQRRIRSARKSRKLSLPATRIEDDDIRLALAAAEELCVPLPLASLLRDRFLTLMAHGGDELDWSAIGGLAAKDAGEEG
jgi:3-hydroxyisobutyrate dehydrogenase-like beta-hydroxyacid dehydrogenase